jgi:alkylated DNA repair dioxygenase AlkB
MYGEHVFAESGPVAVAAGLSSMPPRELLGPPAVVEWQASLFAGGEPCFDATFAGLSRLELDETSWVDHLPRWLDGSDQVFAELVGRLRWRQRTVPMYERLVREPRLTWWWTEADGRAPLAVLDAARHALSARYGRAFDSIGCNYYRTGADSVAWHGDRMRHEQVDPLVAIVSVGAPRPFLLRPRGGGASRSFLLGQGDLLVMGGACQHDWEHSVPKVALAGPRISITYRHGAPAPESLGLLEHHRAHPSASAQNRHLLATGPPHGSGRLSSTGADRPGAGPTEAGRQAEGPP